MSNLEFPEDGISNELIEAINNAGAPVELEIHGSTDVVDAIYRDVCATYDIEPASAAGPNNRQFYDIAFYSVETVAYELLTALFLQDINDATVISNAIETIVKESMWSDKKTSLHSEAATLINDSVESARITLEATLTRLIETDSVLESSIPRASRKHFGVMYVTDQVSKARTNAKINAVNDTSSYPKYTTERIILDLKLLGLDQDFIQTALKLIDHESWAEKSGQATLFSEFISDQQALSLKHNIESAIRVEHFRFRVLLEAADFVDTSTDLSTEQSESLTKLILQLERLKSIPRQDSYIYVLQTEIYEKTVREFMMSFGVKRVEDHNKLTKQLLTIREIDLGL